MRDRKGFWWWLFTLLCLGAATHVLRSLAKDGSWMIVEPYAGDRVEQNLNPVGRAYYSASTLICTPAPSVGIHLLRGHVETMRRAGGGPASHGASGRAAAFRGSHAQVISPRPHRLLKVMSLRSVTP